MISLNIHFGTETSVDGPLLKLMDTCFAEDEIFCHVLPTCTTLLTRI